MTKIDRFFWRDLGVMMLHVTADTGDSFEVISYEKEFNFTSPYITIIYKGAFLTENPHRDPVVWPAFPERAEGGMVFPGTYRLTAQEPESAYACVCFLNPHLLTMDTSLFELEHTYLNLGDSIELTFEDRYRALIVMGGKVTTAAGLKTRGQRVDVTAEAPCKVTAMEATHLVCYRLKDQSNG